MTVEKITRYIRMYCGDDITDPTMYYVGSDQMRFLSWDMYIGLVVRFDNCSMSEIVAGHSQYDHRTIILETYRVDEDTLVSLAKESGIVDVKIMEIKEVKRTPTFYEFSIIGIDPNGTIKFKEHGECGSD